MLSADELRKVAWQSRRGMLELDVLLEPFTREALPTLTAEQQQAYVQLLACEDPELFRWFMTEQRPDDAALAQMVEMVLERGRYQGAAM